MKNVLRHGREKKRLWGTIEGGITLQSIRRWFIYKINQLVLQLQLLLIHTRIHLGSCTTNVQTCPPWGRPTAERGQDACMCMARDFDWTSPYTCIAWSVKTLNFPTEVHAFKFHPARTEVNRPTNSSVSSLKSRMSSKQGSHRPAFGFLFCQT